MAPWGVVCTQRLRPNLVGIGCDDEDADGNIATTGDAAETASAAVVPPSNERRKRRRSNQPGPAHAARRAAFVAAKEHDAADAT